MRARPESTALNDDDLAHLREELRAGKRPRVYLRDAVPSLDIEAASSAQVVSVQGSTVIVRPKGVGDEVPFESGELYRSKAAAVRAGAAPVAPRRARATRPRAPTPSTARVPAVTPPEAASSAAVSPSAVSPPAQKSTVTRVSITITGTAHGGWTVQGAHGSRKLGPATPVADDAVVRAVAELGDPTTIDAVDTVRHHATQVATARVAELHAELERAQEALRALERGKG